MKKNFSKGFTLMEMLIIILLILSFSYFLHTIYSQSEKIAEKELSTFVSYEKQAHVYQTILNDIDSSFLGHKEVPSAVQIKFLTRNHFSFLIQKQYQHVPLHPRDTGLYYVEYRLEEGAFERVLYLVEYQNPSPQDRLRYSNLAIDHLVESHFESFEVIDFNFFVKKKHVELIMHCKDHSQKFSYRHRWRKPFS